MPPTALNPNQRQPQGGLMNTAVPVNQQMNSQFKKVFEDKMGDYIHNMKIVTANLPLIEFKVANSLKHEELANLVD